MPPAGSFAAGVAGAAPPPGSLAAGLPGAGGAPDPMLRALSPPLSAADFVTQYGHAPVSGAPTFEKPSRGEKIARAIMMGLAGAVNPVAGAALLAQHFAEPRLEREQVAEYQRLLPAAQRQADVKAYEDYLNAQRTGADVVTAQASEQRATQNEQLMRAGERAKFLTEVMTDAGKGVSTEEALLKKWGTLAEANPLMGVTAQDIRDAIRNSPPVGPKYKIVWTGPQGSIPHVQDRAGNEFDMKSAPDQEARTMLQMAQEQIDSALKKQEEAEQRRQTFQFNLQAQGQAESDARQERAYQQHQQQQETVYQQHQQQTGSGKFLAAQQTINQANADYDEVSKLGSLGTGPGDMALLTKGLGAMLPEGKSRMTSAEIDMMRRMGSLSDRAVAALKNWTTGTVFAPDVRQELLAAVKTVHDAKVRKAQADAASAASLYKLENPMADLGANLAAQGLGPPPAAGAGASGGGAGMDEASFVAKVKQKFPNASPAQVQDAVARAKQQGIIR